jgi:hypothetical protein
MIGGRVLHCAIVMLYSPNPSFENSFRLTRRRGTGSADVLQVCLADLEVPELRYDPGVELRAMRPEPASEPRHDRSDWLLHSGLWHALYAGAAFLILVAAFFRRTIRLLHPLHWRS